MDWQLLNLGFGAVRLAIFASLFGLTIALARWAFWRITVSSNMKHTKKERRLINFLFLGLWLVPCIWMAFGTSATYGPRVTLDTPRFTAPKTTELPPMQDLSPKVTKDQDRIKQMRDLTGHEE